MGNADNADLGKNMISIIIPVKDNFELTQVCLDSIMKYTTVEHELIIIDDGSFEKAENVLTHPAIIKENVIFIRNEKSVGWCKAINQGIFVSRGEYLVFSNNDTVVTPRWDERMLARFKSDPELGVLAPTSNKVDGMQSIDHNNGCLYHTVDSVIFFFVMISRACLDKVGGLDESFGLGGQDDADFCIRARKEGFKVGISRDVFIYHYGSATFRKEFNNDIEKSKEFAKSRMNILTKKHGAVRLRGNQKKVFICVPNLGTIVPELATTLIRWSHDDRFILRIFMPKNIFPLDAARNKCVKEFLESDYEYLLWIDDDIVPPPDALERLIQADKDMIGAVCFSMKYEKGTGFPYPVTLRYDADKKYTVYHGNGIEEVDATGGACVLFKRHVYEALERPYEFQYHRDGTLALTCDFDVFQKAQQKGFKLFIDFGILCSHIRDVDIKSVQDHLAVMTNG